MGKAMNLFRGVVLGCLIGYAVFGQYTDKISVCVVLDVVTAFVVFVGDDNRRKP
jgi:hypothetical protein